MSSENENIENRTKILSLGPSDGYNQHLNEGASRTLNSTSTPTPTLISTTAPTQTNSFPTETILIAAIAIVASVGVFALAFKKGYAIIEVVDEENPQETSDDYTI